MFNLAKTYFQALFVTGVLDFLWLVVIARRFYQQQIGALFKANIAWWAVGSFYLMYALAISIFVIEPALRRGSWGSAVLLGAFLGFVAYGTYNFTNYATLKDWPLVVLIVDIAWGVFMTALSAVILYKIAK